MNYFNKLYFALACAVALSSALGCAPSPCDELADQWKQCWCAGATPSTTRPQHSIDEACVSRDAFLQSPVAVPDSDRKAILRCDEQDARWAQARMDASECRAGGSYVCGGSDPQVCLPPE